MGESHQKHIDLKRPTFGTFGRTEFSLLGTPCSNIREKARRIIESTKGTYQIAYVDADHKSGDEGVDIELGAAKQFTDKILFNRMDWKADLSSFQKKKLFLDQDLVIVNGNHFDSAHQVVVVDPAKSLEKKIEKLSNPVLFLMKDGEEIPGYLKDAIPDWQTLRVLPWDNDQVFADWVKDFIASSIPAMNGLVLAGGKSIRMRKDKTKFDYHGKPQREYAWDLLSSHCDEVYISCRPDQVSELPDRLNPLPDRFVGLGPFGGIVSAFSHDPNKAWLAIASDLPLLDAETLEYLIDHRNPSKIATCFMDSDNKFPEPLITIWEPRAYQELMFFMSMGHSCPRKTLINSDIERLDAPDTGKFLNVNTPEDLERVERIFETVRQD